MLSPVPTFLFTLLSAGALESSYLADIAAGNPNNPGIVVLGVLVVLMVLGRQEPGAEPDRHRVLRPTHRVNSPHRFRHAGMPIRPDRA